jgi:hypothetical protein
MDAYGALGDRRYLETAIKATEHIVSDLDTYEDGDDLCISYIPIDNKQVHNANVLGASLLARVHGTSPDPALFELARKAMNYTAKHQRPNGSWYYGEKSNLRWVDNFHTAYVLDALKIYEDHTGDHTHHQATLAGYQYWKNTFFLADGTPRYYDHKTMPIDIQCCSQAIDTLVFFRDWDPTSLELGRRVAHWTIEHMQDPDGHFWFRRYRGGLVNKTPTLHWGQATMLCALGGLYQSSTSRIHEAD